MTQKRITTVSQEFELNVATSLALTAASICHGLMNPQHPVGDRTNIRREIISAYRSLTILAGKNAIKSLDAELED